MSYHYISHLTATSGEGDKPGNHYFVKGVTATEEAVYDGVTDIAVC